MTEESKNLIRKEMLNLPKEVQEAIDASQWERISENIGKKYLLDADETETFQLETACFLLGLVGEDLYSIHIEDEVGTSREEARKISEEVFEKIFTPINIVLTEKIKKDLKDKNPSWEQTLDFVLSGGDYSAFLEQKEAVLPETPIINKAPIVNITPPTLLEIQARTQTQDTLNSPKTEDIKNKLLI